jgi:glycosyltransferase involved in cell wall biosynthesis
MATGGGSPEALSRDVSAPTSVAPGPPGEIEVALLTGGLDRPYAFGLAMALASRGVLLDVIGSDDVDSPEMHTTPKLNFVNLRGNQPGRASLATKMSRVLTNYARLLRYARIARPRIFHILWNNKFEYFDRTLLMLYYKLKGKRIACTVHNVNAGKRDSNDSLLNRLTLRMQYSLADQLFVHTGRMKDELVRDFGVHERAITVIPFGINNAVPRTDLSPEQAKARLGIKDRERTILFFGAIRPYKGLEYLVEALCRLARRDGEYRLIIAGEPKRGSEKYIDEIRQRLRQEVSLGRAIQIMRHIPDEEVELYFKAADVLALPYTHVFQSGVLFLGYSFGLPVVAADVGSFRGDIVEGGTGFLCKPCDAVDLARAIERYFESDLFKTLDRRREDIRHYASARHSWDTIGEMTYEVYAGMLEEDKS